MTSSIDAFVRILSESVSRPAPVRVGMLGRRGRIRGLTVREVRDLAERHPEARRTVWRLFRLMPGRIEDVSKADVAALFDGVQTALGCRSIVTAFRLARLPSDVFDGIVRGVVDMTTPDPERVDDLFRPREEASDADRAPRPQGVWSDPAVALADVVETMTARGFADPASWTPGRLLYQASKASQREADLERVRMLNATYAHRLSKTKDTTFKSEVSKLAKDL